MRSGNKVHVRDWMESVDEINNDLDEFLDLPGTVAECFPEYETEESNQADERYDTLYEQLKAKVDVDLLQELDSEIIDRLMNWKAEGMVIGMAIGSRQAGLSKEETTKRIKPWFGPGITNGKAT